MKRTETKAPVGALVPRLLQLGRERQRRQADRGTKVMVDMGLALRQALEGSLGVDLDNLLLIGNHASLDGLDFMLENEGYPKKILVRRPCGKCGRPMEKAFLARAASDPTWRPLGGEIGEWLLDSRRCRVCLATRMLPAWSRPLVVLSRVWHSLANTLRCAWTLGKGAARQ